MPPSPSLANEGSPLCATTSTSPSIQKSTHRSSGSSPCDSPSYHTSNGTSQSNFYRQQPTSQRQYSNYTHLSSHPYTRGPSKSTKSEASSDLVKQEYRPQLETVSPLPRHQKQPYTPFMNGSSGFYSNGNTGVNGYSEGNESYYPATTSNGSGGGTGDNSNYTTNTDLNIVKKMQESLHYNTASAR